ncbi:MAG: hypothetical protein Q8N76_05310, partial [Candidatus Omnitrophota bacterium]|nr:hypothetical protein [Candidatus Omnitrophota bacterium]
MKNKACIKLIIALIVVVFLSVDLGYAALNTASKSCLRKPMVFVGGITRKDFIRVSAAAAAMPKGSMDANSQVQGKASFLGFIQERMGELYDIVRRSLAAEVLISNANRNPELKQALIAFLINEIERGSKQEVSRIFFGSMLSRLLTGEDSFKILTSLFKHSIDYKTRVKAVHLIGQIFMVNTESPDFQVNPQDMPEFIKAVVNPDTHDSAVFILTETARKNEKIKNKLINNFLIAMESSQAQGDIEGRSRLSAALGHIASAQEIFDLLREGFNSRLVKYLAKDRKGELGGIGMDTRDICPIGMRRLDTIDASIEILEALGIYDSDLVIEESINLY